MINSLKILFLVNAYMAVSLGIFVQSIRFCNQVGVSPWFAGAGTIALYASVVWGEYRRRAS